jgi:hypothetical protein
MQVKTNISKINTINTINTFTIKSNASFGVIRNIGGIIIRIINKSQTNPAVPMSNKIIFDDFLFILITSYNHYSKKYYLNVILG